MEHSLTRRSHKGLYRVSSVLILILMEHSLTSFFMQLLLWHFCLNPYSNGTLSDHLDVLKGAVPPES